MTATNIGDALNLTRWVEIECLNPTDDPRRACHVLGITCSNRDGYIQSFVNLDEATAMLAYLSAVIERFQPIEDPLGIRDCAMRGNDGQSR